jgi:hypothetical protein
MVELEAVTGQFLWLEWLVERVVRVVILDFRFVTTSLLGCQDTLESQEL